MTLYTYADRAGMYLEDPSIKHGRTGMATGMRYHQVRGENSWRWQGRVWGQWIDGTQIGKILGVSASMAQHEFSEEEGLRKMAAIIGVRLVRVSR